MHMITITNLNNNNNNYKLTYFGLHLPIIEIMISVEYKVPWTSVAIFTVARFDWF
jgi:hypothetical protein